MDITETALPGVLLIEPNVHKDNRGLFMETYHRGRYQEYGIKEDFVQDNYSESKKNTLRGLHYQLNNPQGKLVQVLEGEVFDVAVDIRRGSPSYGKWVAEVLSDKNHKQIYVPPGFAHGFCVLSDTVRFIYKCTDIYNSKDEYGVLWSDAELNIDWPIQNPVLSEKDRSLPTLSDVNKDYLPIYTV